MSNKEHRVSKKYAIRKFSAVGLFLILYALFVLILPYFFRMYMDIIDSTILKDELLYYGIYFIIILFGTLIPFFLMRTYFKVSHKKMNRSISASFVDLFVQSIVCFTLCITLTYVSNILFAYLGLEGKLMSSIGFSFEEVNLSNLLYVFMLIIVTPIIEEYAFRGVLLNTLGKYGKMFGLYASAVVFAFAHMNFSEFLPAFAMGVQLGKISLRYRSIRPTIIIHMLFNALIYTLCVIPSSITKYMAYVLSAIFMFTVYLILTGKYERVQIQKLHSDRITNILFYTRPTVVFALLLMVIYSLLFIFVG